MDFSMFGGQIGGDFTTKKIMSGALGVLLLTVLVALVIWFLKLVGIISGFEGMFNPNWADYDCDIRAGCVTRNLDQREVTNIEQERQRYGMGRNIYTDPNKESFDFGDWRPGVDRPMIPQLEVDKIIRSEEMNEGLTSRDKSNFVFQQVGNDGTVIPPSSNPLFNPSPPVLM